MLNLVKRQTILLIFDSTISLTLKKFLFQKVFITSLVCDSWFGPPSIKNPANLISSNMAMISGFCQLGRGFILLLPHVHKHTQCQLPTVVTLQSDLVLIFELRKKKTYACLVSEMQIYKPLLMFALLCVA